MRYILTDKELKLSKELAGLYYQMDKDCRYVSNSDIERLYGEAAKNPNIHYKALELNRKKYIKPRGKNGVK